MGFNYESDFNNLGVLLNTEKSLQTVGVSLTLDILKYAKRYHVTVSFLADTGLKEATEKVQKFNLLLKVLFT